MKIEVKIPSVGESVTEARIGRWLKPDGARVTTDEPILELETDKANMEIAAEQAGVLKIAKQNGETVNVGDVVGWVDSDGVSGAGAQPKAEQAKTPEREQPPTTGSQSERKPTSPERLSPAVRKMAREHGVDTAQIAGSGRGGRLLKGDVRQFLSSRPDRAEAPARAAGSAGEREQVVPMSLIRKKIAERLVQAQHAAAILTTFNEVDMSSILDLRGRYQESFQARYGIKLGFMSFFVKASIAALKFVPALNASIDGNNIIYKNYFDIGVAVSTDRGLVVPVLRAADQMSFAEVEQALADYAARAREGKITVDELTGGTFTITNGGVFGSLLSTPILNPPQSGILGMHKIEKRAIVVGDTVAIRPMMYLAVSYDHRLIDGKEAVTFLVRIKECIEDPRRLLLGL